MTDKQPVVLFGCIHIGFKYADLEYTKKAVKWAKKNKAKVLLLGDNFENAIATPDKALMMFDQNQTPNEQLNILAALLEPIKSQIVGACTSNHSKRSYRVAGIDLDEQLSHRLGYADKYKGDVGFCTIKAGNQSYRTVYTHGIGSGSNVLGDFRKLNSVYPGVDIIAASHTHTCLTTQEAFFSVNDDGREVNRVTYVRTGSAIEYPAYAEEQLYRPQPKGFSIMWLGTKEKSVDVQTYFDFK